MSPVSSSSNTRVKATLFRSDFASRLDCSGDHHNSPVLQQQQQQSQVRPINTAVCSVETWRSQILVRILVMFWMESYAYDYHQGGGAGDVDYLRSTASLRSFLNPKKNMTSSQTKRGALSMASANPSISAETDFGAARAGSLLLLLLCLAAWSAHTDQ